MLHPIKKISLITLGCVRNEVDSQGLAARLEKQGKILVPLSEADTVIVNTCSFIADAKKESIDTILDLLELKKSGRIRRVIVAGCLAQRYGRELLEELKGVDALMGVVRLLPRDVPPAPWAPASFSYVKICEGCYHHCRFCVIPKIKGKFVSRSMGSIIRQVADLDRQGTKEIILIGQDITAYGIDLYGGMRLPQLLKKIIMAAKRIERIRLLYTYPTQISDELLEVLAHEKKICKYLDMPLQHISDKILKRMGRGMTGGQIRTLIGRIRRKIPGISLRTTFVVGLPGETEQDFHQLLDFVREIRFDKVGVFSYSREEGTPAYDMPDQVPEQTKKKRQGILMREQRKISRELQKRFVGQELEVLIDEKVKAQENIYLGRTEYDAPDVDGLVYVHSQRRLRPGDMVTVKVQDAMEYDLTASDATGMPVA